MSYHIKVPLELQRRLSRTFCDMTWLYNSTVDFKYDTSQNMIENAIAPAQLKNVDNKVVGGMHEG